MVVCFNFGGQQHCFTIPTIEVPIVIHKPGPGPINYPPFLADAIVVASLQALAQKISDTNVRQAAERGFSSAIRGDAEAYRL